MPELTERVTGIERSKIREMFDRAEAAEGDLVRLEVGEPDFDTPEHVVEAAATAAREGKTHYTANAGLPELRAAIADSLAAERDVRVDPETEVCVTAGGMEALHLTLLCVAGEGDEVVLPSPTWPNYLAQSRLAGATPVEVPLSDESGYALDADRVVEAIGDDTAAVVLNSPSNPTGRVHDPDELRAVVEAAADHDAYVVADEVYMGLTYDADPASVASLVDTDNVVLVDSCSKRYAMTGWRVGWLAGPEDVVSAATKIHESTSSCASSVSQHAAIAALTGPDEARESMREAFAERRDLVVDRLDAIDGVTCPPLEGAFYAFVDVSGLDAGDSFEVANRLLDEYGVVTAPGVGFGEAGEGNLRLSYANSTDRLEEGLDRFADFVAEVR